MKTIDKSANLEKLLRFCAPKGRRDSVFNHPMVQAPYAYAIDSYTCVRMPLSILPEIERLDLGTEPNCGSVINDALISDADFSVSIGIPDIKTSIMCFSCGGSGEVCDYEHSEKCQTCDGTGEITCPECGHDADCEDCNGGSINAMKRCEVCRGAGTTAVVELGGVRFAEHHVSRVNEVFPDVKWGLFKDREIAVFMNDDVAGVLMRLSR